MRRRDLLQSGLAGAGGLALPLDALAGVDGESQRLLQRIDRRCARVAERMAPLREVVNAAIPLEEQGIFDSAMDAILGTVVYGELSSVRPERQARPEVQARIAGAAVSVARGMRAIARFLGGLSDARLRELQRALFSDRPRLDALLDRVGAEVLDAGLPAAAVRQLENTLRRMTFRMEEQGSASVFADLIDQFNRLEASVAGAADPFDPVRAATPAALTEAAPPDAPATGADEGMERQKEIALGALLLGVGVVGSALFVAANITTGGYLIWCVCVSIPLILGIVLVIAGGAMLLVEGT